MLCRNCSSNLQDPIPQFPDTDDDFERPLRSNAEPGKGCSHGNNKGACTNVLRTGRCRKGDSCEHCHLHYRDEKLYRPPKSRRERASRRSGPAQIAVPGALVFVPVISPSVESAASWGIQNVQPFASTGRSAPLSGTSSPGSCLRPASRRPEGPRGPSGLLEAGRKPEPGELVPEKGALRPVDANG